MAKNWDFVKILFADTDTLICEIQTENVISNVNVFSNYSDKSKWHDDSNALVVL